MAKVIRSAASLRDAADIWRFIAVDNVPAANKLLDRFSQKLTLLAQSPGVGRSRNDLQPGLRSFVVGNYVLLYLTVSNGIELVRIAHGARDLPGMFDPDK